MSGVRGGVRYPARIRTRDTREPARVTRNQPRSGSPVTERQLRLGPRIDLWPMPGRLRMGVAFVRSWRRSETVFARTGFSSTTRTSDNMYEVQVGVVPLRWHGLELELSGSFSREP